MCPRRRPSGQRPNSGVYLQQRYEIQILDSFGIVMRQHDCGVLYAQITPEVNMCYPPLSWQTYDIDFTAARYDAAGKKTSLGRCTVKLNGVVILDDVEIKGSTPEESRRVRNPLASIYRNTGSRASGTPGSWRSIPDEPRPKTLRESSGRS